MPEKFGIDMAFCAALLDGGTPDGNVCPKAGAAAASVTSKMKYRRSTLMISLPFMIRRAQTSAGILYEDENSRRLL
jgi:hypothetical protein